MVTVLVAAQQTDLTTLDRVKSAVRATTQDSARDADLAALISEASDAIERELARGPLGREQVEERAEGTDRTTMAVSRRPVASIDQVDNDDLGTVDLDHIRIDDAAAGIVWREDFWTSDLPRTLWLTLDRQPQSGTAKWLIRMTCGWLLPGDDFAAAGFSLTADGVLTRPTGSMPLLVPGDVVRLRGCGEGNNGRYPVTARDDSTITLLGSFDANPTLGNDAVVECRNLDARIERCCIETVKAWYLSEGRDPVLTAERLGDWSADYGAGRYASARRGILPDSVLTTLSELGEVASA